MPRPILITGIGTDIGKTLVAAVVTEALHADYWKPVQAGYETGTDAQTVASLISNADTIIHKEAYCLSMPASPHIAAANEGIEIDMEVLRSHCQSILQSMDNKPLIVEGAGGLLVPLNKKETIADLAKAIDARIILVSRNYLGSINHSRLTAAYCKQAGLDVMGWIFNDQYLDYENEIVEWTGYPSLGTIAYLENKDSAVIQQYAESIRSGLYQVIGS
ncbi:dethiobiotin synthase [Sediminibacterium goheungense]|uniref:ATP-dependent dethiobiotin synthetase BioD n=1 Tax=Sediminibacterium goheungense TaxID=1086393 RepID=A0A4V3C4A3_9BACT|nr:dethiobiotin synthase [Sediminibacterium goheungense]TDO25148.1 dethiobiotin synthetase [Sediminibacterium goheungense]